MNLLGVRNRAQPGTVGHLEYGGAKLIICISKYKDRMDTGTGQGGQLHRTIQKGTGDREAL